MSFFTPTPIWKDPVKWSQKATSLPMMIFFISFQCSIIGLLIWIFESIFKNPIIIAQSTDHNKDILNFIFYLGFLPLLILAAFMSIMYMYALNKVLAIQLIPKKAKST